MAKEAKMRGVQRIKTNVIYSPKAIDLISNKVYAKHVLERKERAREILDELELLLHTSCSCSLCDPGGAIHDSVSDDLHVSSRISVELFSVSFQRTFVKDSTPLALCCCYLSSLVDEPELLQQWARPFCIHCVIALYPHKPGIRLARPNNAYEGIL